MTMSKQFRNRSVQEDTVIDFISYDKDSLLIGNREFLEELSGLTQFLESYYLTLRACHMRQRQFDEKKPFQNDSGI